MATSSHEIIPEATKKPTLAEIAKSANQKPAPAKLDAQQMGKVLGARWFQELHKFIGIEVTVLTAEGSTLTGHCIAFCPNHLNVILRKEGNKLLIRNPVCIERSLNPERGEKA